MTTYFGSVVYKIINAICGQSDVSDITIRLSKGKTKAELSLYQPLHARFCGITILNLPATAL